MVLWGQEWDEVPTDETRPADEKNALASQARRSHSRSILAQGGEDG